MTDRSVHDRAAERLEAMERDAVVERIWARDHTVWRDDPEEIADRLGWLDAPETMRDEAAGADAFAEEARRDGFEHAVLSGMGGSSLAPEVFRAILGTSALDLTVLDTTHPGAVASLERSLDFASTMFVVSSKSGGTIETMSHEAYFFERAGRGERFAAVTDPGSPLAELAARRGYRAIFLNPPDVGGRYSALTLFGLVPAALIGAQTGELLAGAAEMADACRAAGATNPGASLGAIAGEAALAGRDKLTLLASAEAAPFGAWVEQLVAESTGKEGRGIVPVVGEELGPPKVYGDDRIFVALGDVPGADALEAAGHPVVRTGDPAAGARALGAEMFRWEMATAVAGHVLGVQPFDQPDVAAAKAATAEALRTGAGDEDPGDVRPVLASLEPGDVLALLAFVEPSPAVDAALARIRSAIRERARVATTAGYGPRYLHSTGQLHKGGGARAAFVQIVDERRDIDLPVPGRPYTFGRLIDAQAAGDLHALRAAGRRVVRTTMRRLEEAVLG